MSNALPDAQARDLAQTYLLLDKLLAYYQSIEDTKSSLKVSRMMMKIAALFRIGGLRRCDRKIPAPVATRNLALSILGGPQGSLA